MLEVIDHRLEQLFDKLVSEAWLELQKELVAIDELLVIVGKGLLDVHLDLVVENLGQRLAHARVVQLDQPDVNLVALRLHNVDVSLKGEKSVDGAHDNGEDEDTDELNAHSVQVLFHRPSKDVSIADRGQSRDHPVKTRDVDR